MHTIRHASHSHWLPLRHLNYHLRQWGTPPSGPDAPAPLVLLHGWMDVSASWQFMVDALAPGRWVVAPDWRGYGPSRQAGAQPDSYWFVDYLADLDFLLQHISPGRPVDLVGHSMGGNVAMTYSGLRPERIRRLVNVEGFGMPASRPGDAPKRLRQWMDQLAALHAGEKGLRPYPSLAAVAERLQKTNPRLSADKAAWLAPHWAEPDGQGAWVLQCDAAHKLVNPYLYQAQEQQAIFAEISAPVLSVTASDDSLAQWWGSRMTLDDYHQRMLVVPQLQHARIEDCSHMVQHDQPAALARLIENFLA